MATEFRLPLESIHIKPNVSAGISPWVFFSLWHMMRSTTQDPPAIVVKPSENGYWELQDGRHRFMAAIASGRRDILAEVEKED